MKKLIARVELHGFTDESYEKLHEAMAAFGFDRSFVNPADGMNYVLPNGTYYSEKVGELSDIRIKVSAIADSLSTRKKASVWLCEFQDCNWYLYKESN